MDVWWEILSVLAPVVGVALLGLMALYALSRTPRRPQRQKSTGPRNRACHSGPRFHSMAPRILGICEEATDIAQTAWC
jgi:hypothetical protein